MNSVYAQCPVHGSFPSRLFSGNVQGLTLTGNTETCPQCGTVSRTMEGTFNVGQGFVEVLSAPAWTKAMLSEIRNSLRTAQSVVEETNDTSAIHEAIAQLRHEIGVKDAKLDAFIAGQTHGKKKAQIQAFLAILLALFTWAVPASEVQNFTVDTVGPIVETLLEKYADDSSGDDSRQDTETG